MLTLQIYFIQFTQWLSQPFLKWKAKRIGLFSILNDFCTTIRKASIPGAFIHEINDLYIIYDLFCGIHVRLKHHNALFLSAFQGKHLYATTGRFEIKCIQMKNITIFEPLYRNIDLSIFSHADRWILYYKNKEIDYITCELIIMDSKDIWLFTFDKNFNMINIRNNSNINVSDPVSIKGEMLLLRLFVSRQDSEISQLFPEYYTPSVYDFNSDEFSSRLKLADIL